MTRRLHSRHVGWPSCVGNINRFERTSEQEMKSEKGSAKTKRKLCNQTLAGSADFTFKVCLGTWFFLEGVKDGGPARRIETC